MHFFVGHLERYSSVDLVAGHGFSPKKGVWNMELILGKTICHHFLDSLVNLACGSAETKLRAGDDER